MKKLLFLLLFIPVISCQQGSKLSNEEVMEAFESFFELIDNDVDNIRSIVTDDFYIFENSRRYSTEEFIEFVKGFDIIDVKRDFIDIDIDSDYNSAHITLTQFAEAKVNTPNGEVKMNFEWLESAYLVKENKSLKFKFYFSEVIKNSTVIID